MPLPHVDLILLSPDSTPPRPDVWAGIQAQRGVHLHFHRQVGTRFPDDPDRIVTITRARNASRDLGSSPLVMLLDDDVVLAPDCLARLADGLQRRPAFAALAADSDGEMTRHPQHHWDYPPHVSMAAVMFRRHRLESLTFRAEPDKCECRCCGDDLRRRGLAIGYLAAARAWHRPQSRPQPMIAPELPTSQALHPPGVSPDSAHPPGRVLATFDRRHLRLFLQRFVGSFRKAGNPEVITAVATALRPSEQRRLAHTPGIELISVPDDGHPSRRRPYNLARAVESWPDDTPIAYWDAGDVLFQAPIAPLWALVHAHPDRILAVPEALQFHQSCPFGGALWWINTITDQASRRRVLDLLLHQHVVNAGFAAGTVWAMKRYLDAASRLIESPLLQGSTDFGDQTAMNVFLYSHPDAWLPIPSGWNYCLVGLPPGSFRVAADGWTERLDGEPLYVVHGAARTLGDYDLLHLAAGTPVR